MRLKNHCAICAGLSKKRKTNLVAESKALLSYVSLCLVRCGTVISQLIDGYGYMTS
jgi:hypothetical protein